MGSQKIIASVGCSVISVIHVAIVLSHKKGMLYFYRSFTQILNVAERISWVNSQLLSYIIGFFFPFTIWLFIL